MEINDEIEDKLDKDMKDNSCTGIRLGPKLKAKLEKLAEKEDRSVSSIIRVLIVEALHARKIKF